MTTNFFFLIQQSFTESIPCQVHAGGRAYNENKARMVPELTSLYSCEGDRLQNYNGGKH